MPRIIQFTFAADPLATSIRLVIQNFEELTVYSAGAPDTRAVSCPSVGGKHRLKTGEICEPRIETDLKDRGVAFRQQPTCQSDSQFGNVLCYGAAGRLPKKNRLKAEGFMSAEFAIHW